MSANTTTTTINVAYPDTNGLNLKLGLGACKLKVKPGDSVGLPDAYHVNPNFADPFASELQLLGGFVGEIDDSTLNDRSPVIDSDNDGPVVL